VGIFSKEIKTDAEIVEVFFGEYGLSVYFLRYLTQEISFLYQLTLLEQLQRFENN